MLNMELPATATLPTIVSVILVLLSGVILRLSRPSKKPQLPVANIENGATPTETLVKAQAQVGYSEHFQMHSI